MLSIAGYLRISVDEELDRDNVSIENQRAIIQKYVEDNFPGAKLDFFADRDMSGYTFGQRVEYQRMRGLLFAHQYQIMIIKDLSRFSRRLTHGLGELEELVEAGVRIIAISDGVDIRSFSDYNMLLQIRFMLNENAVTETSRKVREIIQSRQHRGEWICAAPFGYYLNPLNTKEILVDEQAATIVRRIFELYNEGWGYKRIANYLTDQGIPTATMLENQRLRTRGQAREDKPADGVWSAVSIAKYIANDFYIGTLRQHQWKRRGINKTDVRVPEAETLAFPNHHTPIVDISVFQKAQENRARRTLTNYRGIRKYPNTYSGFLYCADCGSPMFITTCPPRPPGYNCAAYHRRGLKGCTSHHIREKDIDAFVFSYIALVRDHLAAALTAPLVDASNTQSARNALLIKSLQEKLAAAKESLKLSNLQRIAQLVKRPEDGDMVNATFDEVEREYYSEIRRLTAQLELLEDQAGKQSALKANIKSVIERFDRLLQKERLEKADVATIIDKISVDKDKVITVMLKADLNEIIDMIDM